MATHAEKSILPPSQTRGGNAPDADATTSDKVPSKEAVDRSVRDAAMNAQQAVRDYSATKAVA